MSPSTVAHVIDRAILSKVYVQSSMLISPVHTLVISQLLTYPACDPGSLWLPAPGHGALWEALVSQSSIDSSACTWLSVKDTYCFITGGVGERFAHQLVHPFALLVVSRVRYTGYYEGHLVDAITVGKVP